MNWSLAKIRLSGIGPRDARFDPVEIDLLDGNLERALDTILWLVNGGGKTVLIRLLFSVLRPDRVHQIGIEDQLPDGRVGRRGHRINHLGGYVLPTDTAHVILEWRLTDRGHIATPRRLVTGLVAAWRAGRATGELSNLRRVWYTVNSDDGALGADDLVLSIDEHRVPLNRFRDSLDRMARTDPPGRGRRPLVRAFDVQEDWLRHLDDLGLDPSIFGYELTMNRGESSANNLLSFVSDREFIGFLLRTIIDADAIAGVDTSLAAVAAKIARVPETERELSFVTGVAGRLDPLAAAVADIGAARAERATAERAAESLRGALAAAERGAQTRIDESKARDERYTKLADDLGRHKGVIDAEVRELRLMAAEYSKAEATEKADAADRERGRRETDAAAWGVVERLVRRDTLDGEIESLAGQVAKATAKVAPLQARRDDAGERLRNRLLAEVVAQRGVVAAETEQVTQRRDAARALDSQARDAREEAVVAKGRREALERDASAAANRRSTAVRNGLLAARETAVDALARNRTDLDAGTTRMTAISDRQAEIAVDIDHRIAVEGESTRAAAAARAMRDADATAHAAAAETRRLMAVEPLIRELAEADAPDLDAVGPIIVERLADRAATAAKRSHEVAVRSADDRRALEALDRTHALPPSLDVEAALAALSGAGIAAVSGWTYLAEAVRVGAHESVIRAVPDLVAGVIVTRPDELDAARAALDAAGLETTSVLSVTAGKAIVVAEDATAAADRFVVLPPSALHDSAAAPDEKQRRSERVRAWDDQATDTGEAEAAARRLAETLAAHLEAWPPGSLREAAKRLAEADARIADIEASITASVAERTTLRREAEALTGEARRLAEDGQRLAGRVPELERLVVDEQAAATRAAQIATLEKEVADWRAVEEAQAAEATREHEAADLARDRASEAKGAVGRLADEIGRVVLTTSPVEPDAAAARALVDASESLDVLRSRFRTLNDELVAKTTASPAAVRLEAATEERAAILAELATTVPAVLERATALHGSAEGRVDAERRRQAAAAAAAASLAAVEAAVRAQRDVEFAADAVKEALRAIEAAHFGRRPEVERPGDRILTELAIAAKGTDRARVEGQETEAATNRDEARRLITEDTIRVEHLVGQRSVIEGRLGPELGLPVAADPFGGDREAVVAAVRGAGTALDAAEHARRKAEERWRVAAERLASFLHEGRNDALAASALGRRVGVLATSPTDVEGVAAEVKLREERLRNELTELRTHRELLVNELAEATDRALREIAQAERRSRLPDGLHDWSREPFLQIRFERPGSDDLRARLTGFVADVVARPPDRRPAGAELLLQACEAAVVGDFKVSLLKPNDAYALRYVPVAETAVMSNGQRATAAMCLLMILTELRAKNRAKGVPGVGVLFLDNPFGNASAGYLVAVQRRVAEALGIQPVYTTGVRDYDAFAPFRNKVALSNDQALGRMLRYVRANPALLAALEPRDPLVGHLAASRVVTMETVPVET